MRKKTKALACGNKNDRNKKENDIFLIRINYESRKIKHNYA